MEEIILSLSIGIVLFLGGNHLCRLSCEQYGKTTEREVKYKTLSGCFVKMDNGKFIHLDQIREVL